MKAPNWYPEWRDGALHELVAKRDQLERTHRVGDWPRFDLDLDTRMLTFSEDGHVRVVADTQLVGSTERNEWQWSWANPHCPADVCLDMFRVRDFGVEHGIEELTTEFITDSDVNALGWALTAVAARILEAPGSYRPPREEDGAVFLVLRSVEFVS